VGIWPAIQRFAERNSPTRETWATIAGKSYLCVFLLQKAQKYKPLTFIFEVDIPLVRNEIQVGADALFRQEGKRPSGRVS
jgi:hypothetical protein